LDRAAKVRAIDDGARGVQVDGRSSHRGFFQCRRDPAANRSTAVRQH
jgi:hypothetical protein